MAETLFLILLGLLMTVWSLTATTASLRAAPELTGLDLIDTEGTAYRHPMQPDPSEISTEDVTLIRVDPTRHN
ncbi:hypothetical protein [Salinibacter altiplanensis]|uniref:hypothetical protein n=1 Tax=Salinibacter altiplanensis TaxID=1803181 RepID=UPI0013000FD7|nr:hypothetical protein [Salinibacter altiplanensis]